MESNSPIACSLSSADMRARQAEWKELLRRASKRTGSRAEFPQADPEIRDRLTRLVKLEQECCPFLEFQIEESDDALVLTASGPPEAEPILRELLSPAPLP